MQARIQKPQNDYLLLDDLDNTLTALRELKSGLELSIPSIDGEQVIVIKHDIPFAHKFSRMHISQGGEVIKYGEVIGVATIEIFPGDYVHIHNVESIRARAYPR